MSNRVTTVTSSPTLALWASVDALRVVRDDVWYEPAPEYLSGLTQEMLDAFFDEVGEDDKKGWYCFITNLDFNVEAASTA